MGERSVEIIARWAEAIRHGDPAEELWGANLEIVNAEGWPLEATYHGHDGLRRWWRDLEEACSDLTLEFEEITPIDEERVLTAQRWAGTFRATGLPCDGAWASIMTVRDGRIVRAVGYLTKRRALRALAVRPGERDQSRPDVG
jgi:ketosteroid isomerase-like protein